MSTSQGPGSPKPADLLSRLAGEKPPASPARAELPKMPGSAAPRAAGMPGQVTAKNNPGSLADPDFTKKAMSDGAGYKSMFADVRAKSAELQATHAAERAATPPPSRVADFARGGGMAKKAASNMAAPAAAGASVPIAGAALAPELATAAAAAPAAGPVLSLGSAAVPGVAGAAAAGKGAPAEQVQALASSVTETGSGATKQAASPQEVPSQESSLSDLLSGVTGGGDAPEDPDAMGSLLDSLTGPMPTS
jgi:hypothetical protein